MKEQQIVFEEQLRWSIDLNLPVAIHTRDAYPEVLECIHKVGAERLKGVFHSFTGTTEELEEIKKLPTFKIGINGVVTFKNSKLSEVIRQTDLERYSWKQMPLSFTSPYRGRRNEPTYIWKTAEKVAETFGLTLEETVNATRKNTLELFKSLK